MELSPLLLGQEPVAQRYTSGNMSEVYSVSSTSHLFEARSGCVYVVAEGLKMMMFEIPCFSA